MLTICVIFPLQNQDKYLAYDSANNSIGESTLALFLSNVPAPLRSAGKWAVFALMDPPLLKAMGFPQASELSAWAMRAPSRASLGIRIRRWKII